MSIALITALFAVGPTGPGPLTDVVTAVAKASKGAPDIVEIEAAEAISKPRTPTKAPPSRSIQGPPPISMESR